MKKGYLALTTALLRRGAPKENLAKWAATRYGGCETSWRTWINDPAKMKLATLRQINLSDKELLDIIK